MKREVFFALDRHGAIVFCDISESPLALPDARARWEAIWRHRETLDLLVHSHPVGPHAFSTEDESTMTAVEAALGRPLAWAVVSPEGVLQRREGTESTLADRPWWTRLLELASGMG